VSRNEPDSPEIKETAREKIYPYPLPGNVLSGNFF